MKKQSMCWSQPQNTLLTFNCIPYCFSIYFNTHCILVFHLATPPTCLILLNKHTTVRYIKRFFKLPVSSWPLQFSSTPSSWSRVQEREAKTWIRQTLLVSKSAQSHRPVPSSPINTHRAVLLGSHSAFWNVMMNCTKGHKKELMYQLS